MNFLCVMACEKYEISMINEVMKSGNQKNPIQKWGDRRIRRKGRSIWKLGGNGTAKAHGGPMGTERWVGKGMSWELGHHYCSLGDKACEVVCVRKIIWVKYPLPWPNGGVSGTWKKWADMGGL